ncbi:hypothetical protein KBC80_03015 [Candidatus Woesebacteria bacterium]|nr:hypothetical protein [Candidatus Woesebacteria bacterium]
MNTLGVFLYVFLWMIAAYAPYKPNQKKLFIGASHGYAWLVSIWFTICIVALMYPTIPFIRIDNRFNWVFPFITIIWFVSPYIVRRFGREPKATLSDSPARLLIRFESKIFMTKYFEILFQQSMFIYILFVLLRGQPFWMTIVSFIVIIGMIHLGNFPFTGKKDTLFYFYLSLPMAAVFGILILNGYVSITIAIHMIFYLVFNGRYWFARQNRT